MTIYPIGTKNDDETRNIINNNFGFLRENSNELLRRISDVKKYIDNKGEEILSESVVKEWLSENEFKPKEAVATFNDLPQDAELKELRGVIDENAVYVYDGVKWIKQSELNFDGLGEVKTTISDRINVKSFDVVGDGVTDDTVALQKAIDYAITNKVKLNSAYLKCRTTDTIYIRGPLILKGKLEVYCDHNKIGVEIAKVDRTALIESSDRSNTIDLDISVTRKNYMDLGTCVGIYIANVYLSNFKLNHLKNHKVGLVVDAVNNHGTSYNKFNLGRFGDCYDGIHLLGSEGGFVTENTFFGGSFGGDSIADSERMGTHLKIFGHAISHSNNNKFYNPSFEGFHRYGVSLDNTDTNVIYNARFEMPHAINLLRTTKSVQSTYIDIQYGIEDFVNFKKFKDEGRYTRVTGSTGPLGYVMYYDRAFYEFVQDGAFSKLNADNYKKVSIGRKSQKTFLNFSSDTLVIDLNEADHFSVEYPSKNIKSVTFDFSKMDIGEQKTLSFLQGPAGVNITGFPNLFFGKKAAPPENRAYGRDVYTIIKGTTANEVYALSHYAN